MVPCLVVITNTDGTLLSLYNGTQTAPCLVVITNTDGTLLSRYNEHRRYLA